MSGLLTCGPAGCGSPPRAVAPAPSGPAAQSAPRARSPATAHADSPTPDPRRVSPAVAGDLADEERQIAALEQARASFAEFIARAADDPDFATAVARSRERIEDIDATIVFIRDSQRARLAAEP